MIEWDFFPWNDYISAEGYSTSFIYRLSNIFSWCFPFLDKFSLSSPIIVNILCLLFSIYSMDFWDLFKGYCYIYIIICFIDSLLKSNCYEFVFYNFYAFVMMYAVLFSSELDSIWANQFYWLSKEHVFRQKNQCDFTYHYSFYGLLMSEDSSKSNHIEFSITMILAIY